MQGPTNSLKDISSSPLPPTFHGEILPAMFLSAGRHKRGTEDFSSGRSGCSSQVRNNQTNKKCGVPTMQAKLLFRVTWFVTSFSRVTRDQEVEGYKVPGGSLAIVNLWQFMNDPDHWDRPHQFRSVLDTSCSLDTTARPLHCIAIQTRRGSPVDRTPFPMQLQQ